MITNPFPGSRPLTAADIAACPQPEERPDGLWQFVSLSDQVTWRRCDCPWWHRLPFAGRFVHARLP